MFFRKKKAPAPAPEPSPEALEEAPTDSTTQFLTGEARKDRQSVHVLLDAIARVSEYRDLDQLLSDIVDRSVEITGAERGLLLMRAAAGELTVRVARGRDGVAIDPELRFSTTVANRVLDRLEPVRATVNTESEALDLGRSVYDLKLRAVMCVPLSGGDRKNEGEPKGVLYVDSRAATREFSQRELSLFAALAKQMSIAMENARLHLDSIEKERLRQSMALASAIQQDLMPEVPGHVPGFDLHGWYRPAESAAGDFYDFVETGDGRLAVVVGDATGHGVGPALITATVQGGLRSYLQVLTDTGEVVTRLNRDLCKRVKDGRFMTLFLGILAPDGTLEALNAGHEPALLWRAGGGVQELRGNGPALGMLDGFEYRSHPPVTLKSGDTLVLFTDGISEARGAADEAPLFGTDGVRRVLAELAPSSMSAKQLALRLAEQALKVAGERRDDDMTLLVVRRA